MVHGSNCESWIVTCLAIHSPNKHMWKLYMLCCSITHYISWSGQLANSNLADGCSKDGLSGSQVVLCIIIKNMNLLTENCKHIRKCLMTQTVYI